MSEEAIPTSSGRIWGRGRISCGGKSELLKFSSKEKITRDALETAAREAYENDHVSGQILKLKWSKGKIEKG